MKRKSISVLFILVCMICALSTATVFGAEVLIFESGFNSNTDLVAAGSYHEEPTKWGPEGGVTLSIEKSGAQEGTGYLKIAGGPKDSGSRPAIRFNADRIAPNKTYKISMYAKKFDANKAVAIYPFARVFGGEADNFPSVNINLWKADFVELTTDWQKITGTIEIKEEAEGVYKIKAFGDTQLLVANAIECLLIEALPGGADNNADFAIDNFRMYEITEGDTAPAPTETSTNTASGKEDTPAVVESPKTGDSGILLFVLLAATAVVYIVRKKPAANQ